ncbi:MAG: GC-type dockerin domain-anchored protein [Phycisphaerales bacterium JB040]
MLTRLIACAAALATGATAANAQIACFEDNFEDDDINAALINNEVTITDDWIVGANVWDEFYLTYLYGYFAFPAPNNNGISGTGVDAFSGIVPDQGGEPQGAQVLSVYSDYNNADHALGFYIETNFFREWVIDASNVGETWTFSFDAKQGDLANNTDPLKNASAFIKTINPPSNGGNYELTTFLPLDLTNADPTWQRYEVSLEITAGLVGQLFQVGWLSLCTNYEPSSMFYDNVLVDNGTCTVDPCQADVNGDGILDNGDIGAFVSLFLAGDLAADFTNDGILDNGDIGAFVAAFLAGC